MNMSTSTTERATTTEPERNPSEERIGARLSASCCAATGAPSCGPSCAPGGASAADEDAGSGCGNPAAVAALCEGEVVLELGCGAGFDSLVIARQVGRSGRVIGVDITPEMIARARANARRVAAGNVELRLGELEHLPVADASADVVLANCVLNLAADKRAVLGEAFRALRPGGRLAISEAIATAPIPDELRREVAARLGCVAGAVSSETMCQLLETVGFIDIAVEPSPRSPEIVAAWHPGLERFVASATIVARKPGGISSTAQPASCCSPSCCP